MGILKHKKPMGHPDTQSDLAEMALKNIHDGVIITDADGVVQFINPAGVEMTGVGGAAQALGLDYGLILKLGNKEGDDLPEIENRVVQAMNSAQDLEKFQATLAVGQSDKRIPVALSVTVVDNTNRIITFRDITKELAEEGEQAEFISTASHEMRTPVATIDGYLSLALNPQTAAIDDRARGYLESAQKASKHLGKLFQDLLDVTKMDDGHIHAHLVPTDLTELVKNISADYAPRAQEAGLNYTFGASDTPNFRNIHRLPRVIYGFVDQDFMREIMDNLIENAIKYTPAGGSIYINVRGDNDRALINVTDTGMGISSDDLTHIFQKFYRVDNSDTRTIGGTGLGLYLVKQRVEAMGGRVWAESAFGEGSTFYVSLPRISSEEYERRMIAVRNEQIQEELHRQEVNKIASMSAAVAAPTAAPATAPAVAPTAAPSTPAATPATVPAAPTAAPASAPSTPVAAPAPAPAVSTSPAPVATSTSQPAPVAASTPAPSVPVAAPVAAPTPASATAVPAPTPASAPQPVSTSVPAPASTPQPAPAQVTIPTSVVVPAPAAVPAPAPVATPVATPASTSAPAPATTYAPVATPVAASAPTSAPAFSVSSAPAPTAFVAASPAPATPPGSLPATPVGPPVAPPSLAPPPSPQNINLNQQNGVQQ